MRRAAYTTWRMGAVGLRRKAMWTAGCPAVGRIPGGTPLPIDPHHTGAHTTSPDVAIQMAETHTHTHPGMGIGKAQHENNASCLVSL